MSIEAESTEIERGIWRNYRLSLGLLAVAAVFTAGSMEYLRPHQQGIEAPAVPSDNTANLTKQIVDLYKSGN